MAKVTRKGKLTPREWIWGKIREHQSVTISSLLKLRKPSGVKLNDDKISHYLNGWVKSGHLKGELKSKGTNPPTSEKHFTLIKDVGVNPPIVNKDGHLGKGRQQMWRTMRINGDFDYKQLAIVASTEEVQITENAAKTYVSHLYKAGYLKLVKKANHTKSGGLAVYRLKPAADTGNKPPMVKQMNVVFDQNTHEIVWPKPEDMNHDY